MAKIIAFAGRKQSGKTTSAEYVKDLFEQSERGFKSKVYNFADPLKEDVCMNVLGLTYHQCYGSDESKNELVNCYWPSSEAELSKQMTAREVMQYVGTDIFRKIQTNVWSSATITKIKKDNYDLALIADCRFPNEVDAVKESNGFVIKLSRNLYDSNHLSEKALDDNIYDQSNFDLVIDNNHLTIEKQNEIIYQFLLDKEVISL